MKKVDFNKLQAGDLVEVPRTQFAPMRRGWNGWLFSEAVVIRKGVGRKSKKNFTYSGNLEDAIEKAERDLQKEKENKEIAQWYWLYEKAKKAISAHNKKIANIEAFIRCAEEEQEKQKGKKDNETTGS